MSFETLFNPGERPAFVDDAGRTIDPHGFASAAMNDIVTRQVRSGALIVVETPEELPSEISPGAAAAFAATIAARQQAADAEEAAAARAATKKAAAKKDPGGGNTRNTAAPSGDAQIDLVASAADNTTTEAN